MWKLPEPDSTHLDGYYLGLNPFSTEIQRKEVVEESPLKIQRKEQWLYFWWETDVGEILMRMKKAGCNYPWVCDMGILMDEVVVVKSNYLFSFVKVPQVAAEL